MAGWPRFECRFGQEIILFSITFRSSLGLTPPPMQWILKAVSSTPMGFDADHSPPSSVEVTLISCVT
jgi:hypothetical protein